MHRFIQKSLFIKALCCTGLLTFMSCDKSFVYDYEGDCELNYKLKFVYDMNLKWADAFNSEVKSVRVYAFNTEGTLVKEYMHNGSSLSDPEFAIDLELPVGSYNLVAWCGIDNAGVTDQSFSAPESNGMNITSLDCSLNWKSDATYSAYSDEHLQFMYYGKLEGITIEAENDYGGTITYTMPLVKDTNHLRVILTQLSGDATDVNDFTYSIEAANGVMDYQNNLMGNQQITYLPWALSNADVSVGGNTEGILETKSAVADIDLSRFTVGESNSMMLTVRNSKTGEKIATVPVIQYALLAKEYYEFAYDHTMTDQEFLDREDEYQMEFFLDSNMRWISSFIYINSWRVVLHDYQL